MIPVTMLLLFLAALAPFLYAGHEAGIDASKIAQGEPIDHKKNFQMRTWAALLCTIVFFGLLYLCGFRWWFFTVYFFYFAAAFGFCFTKQLSIARGLHPWYVSAERDAAVSDRLIARFAQYLGIPPERFAAIVYTGFLVAGILAFAGAAWISWG